MFRDFPQLMVVVKYRDFASSQFSEFQRHQSSNHPGWEDFGDLGRRVGIASFY